MENKEDVFMNKREKKEINKRRERKQFINREIRFSFFN